MNIEDILDSPNDILVLLLRYELFLVVVNGFWAVLAAVFQTLLHSSEESRVTMEPTTLVLGVERGVHSQVSLVHEFVDAASIPSGAIRKMKRGHVVVVHLETTDGVLLLEVALVLPLVSVIARKRVGSASELPTGLEEGVASVAVHELLKDKQPSETFHLVDGTLINLVPKLRYVLSGGRINSP